MILPVDLADFQRQFDVCEAEVGKLVEGLSEQTGTWQATPPEWSVAHCLDHQAVTNREYITTKAKPLQQARKTGKVRGGPVHPGPLGRLFAKTQEPPVKKQFRIRAPHKIVPRAQVTLADATAQFHAAQREIGQLLEQNADLDLTHILFPNPFVRGLRFGIASGLHIMATHERRHLWQGWRVRAQAEARLKAAGAA